MDLSGIRANWFNPHYRNPISEPFAAQPNKRSKVVARCHHQIDGLQTQTREGAK